MSVGILSNNDIFNVNLNLIDGTGKNLLFFKQNLINMSILINRGINMNHRDIHGRTPLIYHTSKGNLHHVQVILNHGVDINQRWRGKTSLAIAVRHGKDNISKYLCKRGGYPEIVCGKYLLIRKLGSGAYSNVFLGLDDNNKEVAIKEIKGSVDDINLIEMINNELYILKSLTNKPNIINFYEKSMTTIDNKFICHIVQEYIEYDLYTFIRGFRCNFDEDLIKESFAEIVMGVYQCHQEDIVHLDLKTSNILFSTKKPCLKLIDFGMSRKIDQEAYTETLVTFPYRPPEVLLGSMEINKSIDIWSLGCIFAEMFLKERLFKGLDEETVIRQIHNLKLKEIFPEISEDAFDLMKNMLKINSKERIDICGCIDHTFFTDVFNIN